LAKISRPAMYPSGSRKEFDVQCKLICLAYRAHCIR
jgi:hypothetical protein